MSASVIDQVAGTNNTIVSGDPLVGLITVFILAIFIGYIGGYNDSCPGCPKPGENIYYNHAGTIGLNIFISIRT